MGCLTAPFRLLGCLGLIAALALGWLYRDWVVREAKRLLPGSEAPAGADTIGRPGRQALRSARVKIDSLTRGRVETVVLSPAEVASLIGGGMDPALRMQLDSLQVRLLDGEIEVIARLRTARLPPELIGPVTIGLRDNEPVRAAGPLRVTGPGQGEWVVRSFRIRDFRVPADVVPHLVARALGDSTRRTVPVRIPRAIRDIRVRPSGATLYGASRS